MTAAEKLTPAEEVLEVPLGDVLPSRIPNYRRSFNQRKLEELADSMRQVGVLEPIVVRYNDEGGLELVFGERRLRAARLAELPTIKAIVRSYSDNGVRETRLIENAQREDADPLDEAAAFSELTKLGLSPTAIAERIGQSAAYVTQRLQLTTLSEACSKALSEGHITIGVAVLLASLPSEKLQAEGLEAVSASSHYDNRLMTVADARAELESSVMMQLAHAPFKVDDAALVPAAGSCLTCPKRTGGQALLFAEASSPDLCTDKLCYRGKQDAAWKLRQKEAKAAGLNVLGAKEGDEAIKRLIYGDSAYVRLDSEHWDGKRHVQVSKVLGKNPPELTIARDVRTGLEVQLVPKKLFEAAAAKASKAAPEGRSAPDAKAKAEREAELVQAEVRRRSMTALVEATDAACRKGAPPRSLLRLLVRGALESVWTDIVKKVADRRGLPLTDEGVGTTKRGAKRQLERLSPADRVNRLLPDLDEGALFGLLLELVFGRTVPSKWGEASECYVDLCTELDVNPKGIEVTVKAERKAKTKAKADGKKPAAPTPEPSRPKHPATGKPVHYIDPTGLSQSGLACGAQAADGKGVITQEPEKVTCKSCRRVAGLDDAQAQAQAGAAADGE